MMITIRRDKRRIYAMSQELSWIYRKMEQKSDILAEHIGKCIIWGKDYHSYTHWVESEISTFINEFARVKTKSKLKSKYIVSNLFSSLGNHWHDALNFLLDIYEESQMKSNPYPEVYVTDEQGQAFFDCYSELSKVISGYLADHKIIDRKRDYKSEIIPLVYGVLDKYC